MLSFTDAVAHDAANSQEHYLPFTNPKLDLMDVHKYAWPNQSQEDTPDKAMFNGFKHAEEFRTSFPSADPTVDRKPFNHGEFNYFTYLESGGEDHHIEKYFHNYDVSFHNEIWSSAFSGKFAAGTTWFWERVFWWKDALKPPPWDQASLVVASNNPSGNFSNHEGVSNYIDIGGIAVEIKNRKLHHHFKPLADLLYHPIWLGTGFFNGDFTVHKVFDENNSNVIECYYLKNEDNNTAIGWVHNRNAWVMNNFYLSSSVQNFLGCAVPTAQSITLAGFEQDTDYYITWFPTRMNTTVCPEGDEDLTGAGTITLDLSSSPLGGTLNNYLDTLHADYAFIISPEPFAKSIQLPPAVQVETEVGWDYMLYPNPAKDALYLRFPDDAPKNLMLFDAAGRTLASQPNVTGTDHYLSIGQLAKGAYWVHVTDGVHMKVKKLIIH